MKNLSSKERENESKKKKECYVKWKPFYFSLNMTRCYVKCHSFATFLPSFRLYALLNMHTHSALHIWEAKASDTILNLWIFKKVFALKMNILSLDLMAIIFFFCASGYSSLHAKCSNDVVEESIRLWEESQYSEQCTSYQKEKHTNYGNIMAYLYGSAKEKCYEQMRKNLDSLKNKCSPLNVLKTLFK